MKHTNNVVICPPFGEIVVGATERGAKLGKNLWSLLPRLVAGLPPQGREMNGAFTLIELLVVVLIIGILAAVAVPQYQKVVEKSRLAQLMQNIRTMKQTAALYVLENGTPSVPVSLKDILSSAELTGQWVDDNGLFVTDYFLYGCSIDADLGLYCEIWRMAEKQNTRSNKLYALAFSWNPTDSAEEGLCFTYDSSLGNYVCQTLHQWDHNLEISNGEL